MTTEEKVPFSSTTKTWPEDLAYDSAAYMEDAVFSEYDEDRVKLLLSEYKSVSAMMYWNLQNYTVNTAAYYQAVPKLSSNGKQMVNHAVTIVGWDDNYKKENFIDGPKPSRNGAWIVKNSYGTGFGDKGYFYMAYDNATFSAILHQLQKNIIIIIFMMVLPQEPLSFQVFPMDTMLPIFLRQPPEKEKMKSSVRSLLQFHRIILIFRFRFIPI